MNNAKKLSRSRALAARLIYAALSILRDNGKEMPIRDLLAKLEQEVELNDWDRTRYEKSGYIRWESILHFFSIDCNKAGFLVKKKGIWYITPEGEESLKLGAEKLLETATSAYKDWKIKQQAIDEISEHEVERENQEQIISFEQIEQISIEGLEKYINAKNPYEFQDLIAALLRGMGYYTPFVAPKGKDGGVDVMAYRDPLGTQSPRIQVQIKHKNTPTNVQEVRQLMGLLQKEGDVGIFVSTGGFTADAKTTARGSHVHVELIDLTRFIALWQEFYEKMSDEDKSLMPLRPIYFLAMQE
jgi:restriction system protein